MSDDQRGPSLGRIDPMNHRRLCIVIFTPALDAAKEPGRNTPYDRALAFAVRDLLVCLLAVVGRRSRRLAIRAMRVELMVDEDAVFAVRKDDD